MGNKFSTRALAAATFLLLAGCGDETLTGGPGAGGPVDSRPATLTVLADSLQLSSDAEGVSEGVTLTAVVKDGNQNVVPNVTVTFGTSDSAEINVANPAVTDANGRAEAIVTTGGDPTNRSITITVIAGSISRNITLDVVGTTLEITGADNTQIGVPTNYTVTVNDAGGKGLSGITVSASTNAGNSLDATQKTTDASGQAIFTLTASEANSFFRATALGLISTKTMKVSGDQFFFEVPAANTEINIGTAVNVTVRWLQNNAAVVGQVINFGATRGTLSSSTATTDADGRATVTISSPQSGFSSIQANSTALTQPSASRDVEFVAITPASIDLQPSPAVISTLGTSELTATVRDANNNLVKNQTVSFNLISDPSNGQLSAVTAVTGSQGQARVTYKASSQPSGSEGVLVGATVQGTGLSDQTTITVGSSAVGVSIGIGSQIRVKNESTYAYPFTVLVADSAGQPVTGVDVDVSLFPSDYRTGDYASAVYECPNEDINRNSILDPGEDTNLANNELDPGNAIANAALTEPLQENGTAQGEITYAKSFGRFVVAEVKAVVRAQGTEATDTLSFLLPIAQEDVDKLPSNSPFGNHTTNCVLVFTATLPQCGDGIDNDGDGSIDTADPQCADSSDTDESA